MFPRQNVAHALLPAKARYRAINSILFSNCWGDSRRPRNVQKHCFLTVRSFEKFSRKSFQTRRPLRFRRRWRTYFLPHEAVSRARNAVPRSNDARISLRALIAPTTPKPPLRSRRLARPLALQRTHAAAFIMCGHALSPPSYARYATSPNKRLLYVYNNVLCIHVNTMMSYIQYTRYT